MSRRKFDGRGHEAGGGRVVTTVVLTRAHSSALDALVFWLAERSSVPMDRSTVLRVALEMLADEIWPGLCWTDLEAAWAKDPTGRRIFGCTRCRSPLAETGKRCNACRKGTVSRPALNRDPVAVLEGRQVIDVGCRTVPPDQEAPARRQAPTGPPSPAEDYPALGSAGPPSPAEDYPALGSAGPPSPAEDYPALGSAVGPVASDEAPAPSPPPKAAKPKRARKPGKPRKGR